MSPSLCEVHNGGAIDKDRSDAVRNSARFSGLKHRNLATRSGHRDGNSVSVGVDKVTLGGTGFAQVLEVFKSSLENDVTLEMLELGNPAKGFADGSLGHDWLVDDILLAIVGQKNVFLSQLHGPLRS